MKKLALLTILLALLSVQAITVTDIAIDLETEEEMYLPNESVEFTVSTENLDSSTAENATLSIEVDDRAREYDLGDINPGDEFNEEIEIDELPGGTSYQIEAELEYEGFLRETYTETTREGFRVEFPDFLRIPRHIFIESIDLPDETLEGEPTKISSVINHDGDTESDLKLVIQSQGDTTESQIDLNPGETMEESLNKTFSTSGTGFAEARVYAYSENDEFIIDYLSRQIFVESQRNAEIEAETDLHEEGTTATLQLDMKNVGDDAAHNLNTRLESENENIGIEDITIGSQQVITAGEQVTHTYEINSASAEEVTANLEAYLSYSDREEHQISIEEDLSLEGSEARIDVESHEVEKEDRNSNIKLSLSNSGESSAEDVQAVLQQTENLNTISEAEELGSIPSSSTVESEGELEFRASSSSLENLEIPITIEYSDNKGDHSTSYTARIEGGQEEGESCSFNWQCTNQEEPLYCSESVDNGQQSCCPAGTSWDGESCLNQFDFVAVPAFYDENEQQQYEDLVEEQVETWIPKSPFQELENPEEQVNLHLLDIDEVDSPNNPNGADDNCGYLNRWGERQVQNSRYRNTYDMALISTKSFDQIGLLGCAYPNSQAAATLHGEIGTMHHEVGHAFGLGHTNEYGPAERANPDRFYLNDRISDGPGEIMNYCSGANTATPSCDFSGGYDYYSNDYSPEPGTKTEYNAIKTQLLENNWM